MKQGTGQDSPAGKARRLLLGDNGTFLGAIVSQTIPLQIWHSTALVRFPVSHSQRRAQRTVALSGGMSRDWHAQIPFHISLTTGRLPAFARILCGSGRDWWVGDGKMNPESCFSGVPLSHIRPNSGALYPRGSVWGQWLTLIPVLLVLFTTSRLLCDICTLCEAVLLGLVKLNNKSCNKK